MVGEFEISKKRVPKHTLDFDLNDSSVIRYTKFGPDFQGSQKGEH